MRMKMSEVRKRGRKPKETNPVETKQEKKQTRIEYTMSEIDRLLNFCNSEEQEFYAFTAVDQCLKRIVSICRQS